MYEKMQEVGRSIKGAKKSISTWAKGKVSGRAKQVAFWNGFEYNHIREGMRRDML